VCSLEAESSLQWLISPINKRVFFERYWEKQPLVVKHNQPSYFSRLLSLDEVDRVLTTLDRRYPDITLKNADKKITADDYVMRDDIVDIGKVYQLFEEGSTIILAYLDTVVPALTAFCRGLENEFSFPFQTNVYLSPARAKGFKPHYDTHDVFVVQVVGSKQWTIYGTPVELPLAAQDFDASVHQQGDPTLEFELEAGDTAYIPRGFVHDARSGENVSLHVTVGVLSYTWTDLLLEWVADRSLNHPAFRKSLPPGFARPEFDRTRAHEIFRDLVHQLSATSTFEAILDRFVDEFISACPPLLIGQMAQITKLDHLTIDSRVGARTGVVCRLRMNEALTSIDCYGRRITFPAHVSEAVRFALNEPEFAVRELPGDLDDAAKVVLVRRLIREGLLAFLAT
jgi:ribosomal protein L16 Arg81 hydroxylase